VSEEDFLATWKERFQAIRQSAAERMQEQLDQRKKKLGQAAGDDGSGGGDDDEG
jgi:hypothetical protein